MKWAIGSFTFLRMVMWVICNLHFFLLPILEGPVAKGEFLETVSCREFYFL